MIHAQHWIGTKRDRAFVSTGSAWTFPWSCGDFGLSLSNKLLRRQQCYEFGRLRFEVRVVGIDARYAGDDEEHNIGGSGEKHERSESLVLLGMRTGFTQFI